MHRKIFLSAVKFIEQKKWMIVLYATHFGQFETNAELYFASNAMQTARNTANDSQNQNVDKWTEANTNCDDKNTIRAPSSSIAIWHRFTRTNPRKDKKRTKKHEREKTKSFEILNLERQNKRTNHGTSAFAFPLGVVLREQKQLKISGRRNSQETKKGASGGEESHTSADPIPQRKVEIVDVVICCQELFNADLVAKFGVDTAENERVYWQKNAFNPQN